jgi:hypothetical protein
MKLLDFFAGPCLLMAFKMFFHGLWLNRLSLPCTQIPYPILHREFADAGAPLVKAGFAYIDLSASQRQTLSIGATYEV